MILIEFSHPQVSAESVGYHGCSCKLGIEQIRRLENQQQIDKSCGDVRFGLQLGQIRTNETNVELFFLEINLCSSLWKKQENETIL